VANEMDDREADMDAMVGLLWNGCLIEEGERVERYSGSLEGMESSASLASVANTSRTKSSGGTGDESEGEEGM